MRVHPFNSWTGKPVYLPTLFHQNIYGHIPLQVTALHEKTSSKLVDQLQSSLFQVIDRFKLRTKQYLCLTDIRGYQIRHGKKSLLERGNNNTSRQFTPGCCHHDRVHHHSKISLF